MLVQCNSATSLIFRYLNLIFGVPLAPFRFQPPATLPNKSPATTNIPDRPQFVYLTLWTATGGPTKESGPPYTLLYNLITQYHSSPLGEKSRVYACWRPCPLECEAVVTVLCASCGEMMYGWRFILLLCVSEVFCLLEINCRRLPCVCMGCFFRCLHPLAAFWVVVAGCVWYWCSVVFFS